MTIYPDVRVDIYEVNWPVSEGVRMACKIDTHVRVQDSDGKWYLTYVYKDGIAYMYPRLDFVIKNFIRDCYLTQINPAVSDCLDIYGKPLFRLDVDQRSEMDRMASPYFRSTATR